MIQGSLRDAPLVFAAEVVEIGKPYPDVMKTKDAYAEMAKVKVRLKIERVWRGELPEEVVITGGAVKFPDGSIWMVGCLYPFEEGEKYLVYANGTKNELGVSMCSRTRPLDKAAKEVEILDELKREAEKARPRSRTASPSRRAQSNNSFNRTRN